MMLAPALGRVKIGGAGLEAPYVIPGRDGAGPVVEGPAAAVGPPTGATRGLVKGREKFIAIR